MKTYNRTPWKPHSHFQETPFAETGFEPFMEHHGMENVAYYEPHSAPQLQQQETLQEPHYAPGDEIAALRRSPRRTASGSRGFVPSVLSSPRRAAPTTRGRKRPHTDEEDEHMEHEQNQSQGRALCRTVIRAEQLIS